VPKSRTPINSPGEDSTGADLLTVKETSEYLRIPLPTVYYLVQRGQLPAIQIGGRWRIKKNSLDRDILQKNRPATPHILVVDDDPAIQDLFQKLLSRLGLESTIVDTAAAALTQLEKSKFDLMFLDLQLPDVTGDEVFGHAREFTPDLPVIIVTGYPDSDMLDRILRKGPVTVLKKPLNLDQVAQSLKLHGIAVTTAAPARQPAAATAKS